MLRDIFSYALSKNPDISDGLYFDVLTIFAGQEAVGTDNDHTGPILGYEDMRPIKGFSCFGLKNVLCFLL